MAETADNTYATNSSNAAAGAPNKVAVVNDGTGDRQIVTLGAGDGTGTIVDGTPANPQNTKITNGTNIADVMTPGTALSSGNAVLIGATAQSQTFSVTSVSSGTTYDVGNYASVKVQILTQYVGTTPTIAFQASNDGTNWTSNILESSTSTVTTGASSTTGTGIYYGTLMGRYFRLNFTGAYSSGTATGTIVFSTMPAPPQSMGIASLLQSSLSTVTGSITTSSTAVTTASSSGVGGFALISIHGTYSGISFGITQSDDSGTTFYGVPIYDAAAMQWLAPGSTITPGTNASKNYWVPINPASSEIKVLASAFTSGSGSIRIAGTYTAMPGSFMNQIMDAAGNARGANVSAGNALQVEQIFTYAHIATSTTTTVKSGAGFLHAVSVNTLGTVASTTTIYDNTAGSGAIIGIINTLTLSGIFILDVGFTTGLTIVTTGTVSPDITVSYR